MLTDRSLRVFMAFWRKTMTSSRDKNKAKISWKNERSPKGKEKNKQRGRQHFILAPKAKHRGKRKKAVAPRPTNCTVGNYEMICLIYNEGISWGQTNSLFNGLMIWV